MAEPQTTRHPVPGLASHDWEGAARRLTQAAKAQGCTEPVTVAAVRAVAEVEAGQYGAWLEPPVEEVTVEPRAGAGACRSERLPGVPVMLFERHVFRRYTNGRFDRSHPHLSSKTPGGYGTVKSQPARLAEAAALDWHAAHKATSFGRWQVMGFNWQAAGYSSLEAFVEGMCRSEQDHLRAFVGFVEKNGLAAALAQRQWATFARGYNGADFKRNRYDVRIRDAYVRYAGAIERCWVLEQKRQLGTGHAPAPAPPHWHPPSDLLDRVLAP